MKAKLRRFIDAILFTTLVFVAAACGDAKRYD